MARIVPPTIVSKKLQMIISYIATLWTEGKLSSYDEAQEELTDALEKAARLETPLVEGITFQPYEPPLSDKYNTFFSNTWRDFAVISEDLDVLKAWAILCFNHTVDAVDALDVGYSQILEAYKSALALCSSPIASVDSLSVSCGTLNILPWEDFGGGSTTLSEQGCLELSRSGIEAIRSKMEVGVIDGNGFGGNLHQAQLIKDPQGIEELDTVRFDYEVLGRHDDLYAVVDNNPSTWFEYEAVDLTAKSLKKIKGFNIFYKIAEGTVKWCKPPKNGTLFMDLLGRFEEPVTINKLSLSLYTGTGASGPPVKLEKVVQIKRLEISNNGTDWTRISNDDFYITYTENPSDESSYGKAVWTFDPQDVMYVRMRLTSNAVNKPVQIGHYYYLSQAAEERINGPDPEIGNPTACNKSMDDVATGISRRLEVLSGMRWFIGIRDLACSLMYYHPSGTATSKTSSLAKEIDYLSISTEEQIPSDCSITYKVSADDGKTWTEILPTNREQTTEYSANQVVSFNNRYPEELRPANVSYVETVGPANRFKLRAFLGTANKNFSTTPQLISYTATLVFKE